MIKQKKRTSALSLSMMLTLLFFLVGGIIIVILIRHGNNDEVLYHHDDRDENSDNANFQRRRRKTTTRENAVIAAASAGNSNSTSSSTTTATTTLLTRTSQLSSLLANLDASDVIECYILTRMANLANVATSVPMAGGGSSGNNNRRNLQTMEKENFPPDTEMTTPSSSSSSSSIPTGPILIRKAALAFRYRPKVALASSSSSSSKTLGPSEDQNSNIIKMDQKQQGKYFELTLEYGPQRSGASKTFESMPTVHIDKEVMINYEDENNENNDKNTGKYYVSWENQGSIYYSTHISNEWSGAYYMAPITGVVLGKILEKAVEYPNKRPRYQPFEVVSIPSNNIILRSSGSDDFVWDMFRDLADLYVDIDPILVPPRRKVQFYVADSDGKFDDDHDKKKNHEREEEEDFGSGGGGEKGDEAISMSTKVATKRRRSNPNVKRVTGALESERAATFYENFFNCANAKKTGDYSLYLPLVAPSLAPSPAAPPIDDAYTNNTAKYNTTSDGGQSDKVNDRSDGVGYHRRSLFDALNSTVASFGDANKEVDVVKGDEKSLNSSSPSTESEEDSGSISEIAGAVVGGEVVTKIAEGDEGVSKSSSLVVFEEEQEKEEVAVVSVEEEEDDDEEEEGEIENVGPDEENVASDEDNVAASEDDGDAAKVAEKAAIEAAQKAEAAAAVAATNSSSPEDSVKAASEAAIAAKKAADASVAARAKSSAEGLLSGDGALMTSILSSCFSDPKYGIRKMHSSVGASESSNNDQISQISSTYAYVYLDGDVFIRLNLTAPYWGTSTVLQTVPPPHAHVEGQGDVVDWAIFSLLIGVTIFGFIVIVHQIGLVIDKRLQFRHVFHPLADDDSVEIERLEKGGGSPHAIGIDAIPVSLGGKLSRYDGHERQVPPTSYKDRISDSSIDGDESNCLIDIELSNREIVAPKTSDLPTSLRLKEEAPDLVERPSLKSMSKVALPHHSPRNEQERPSLHIEKTNTPEMPSI